MNIGERFDIHGYDIVARATHDAGEVLVLNNNSTHYLVGVVNFPDDATSDHAQARLAGSFRYSLDFVPAYQSALMRMVSEAVRLTTCEDADGLADACPGCGRQPGDGVSATCDHPDGCGYWKSMHGEPSRPANQPGDGVLYGILADGELKCSQCSWIGRLAGRDVCPNCGAPASTLTAWHW